MPEQEYYFYYFNELLYRFVFIINLLFCSFNFDVIILILFTF